MEILSSHDPRLRTTKYVAIIPSGYGPQYRAFIGSDERTVVEDALQERAASGRNFPIWFGTLHAQVETQAYRLAPLREEEVPSERPAQTAALRAEETVEFTAPEPAMTSAPPPRRGRGRPPGSKNKPKNPPPQPEPVRQPVETAPPLTFEQDTELEPQEVNALDEEVDRARAIMLEVRRAEYEAERRKREVQGIKMLMPTDEQLEQNAAQHLTSFVQTTFGTDARLHDLGPSQLVQLNALLEARLRISGGRMPGDEE